MFSFSSADDLAAHRFLRRGSILDGVAYPLAPPHRDPIVPLHPDAMCFETEPWYLSSISRMPSFVDFEDDDSQNSHPLVLGRVSSDHVAIPLPRRNLYHQDARAYLNATKTNTAAREATTGLKGRDRHGGGGGGVPKLFPFGAANRVAHGDDPPVFPGYTLIKKLKTGGMSEAIYLIKKNSSGKLYIEKYIGIDCRGDHERAATELATLKRITNSRNRNLNYYVDSMWGARDSYLSLVLEYCDADTVDSKIASHRRRGQNMSEEFLWHLLLGISNALAFLHAGIEDATVDQRPARDWNAICHLDLKAPNVFLTTVGQSGPYPRVVVGDFGCVVTSNQITSGLEPSWFKAAGTPEWDPPEVRRGRYGVYTDNYQCGAIVHACARLIYEPDKNLVAEGRACGSAYSRQLNDVVQGAMDSDYHQRFSSTKMVRYALRGLERFERR